MASLQVAVKGDEYLIEDWVDDSRLPENQNPPSGPDMPPDEEHPNPWYSSPPSRDPLYDVTATDKPDNGSEFVFCGGKAVVFVGYEFSHLKKDTIKREWELNDKGQIKGKKEEKKSCEELDITAVDGSDFVFIDGIPMCLVSGGVEGKGQQWAYIDGKKEDMGALSASGKFTKSYGNVFIAS